MEISKEEFKQWSVAIILNVVFWSVIVYQFTSDMEMTVKVMLFLIAAVAAFVWVLFNTMRKI